MEQLSSVSILLVEDNKVNQLVASELLTSEGATVDIADNGSVGVNMLGAAPDKYDVILMDIQMPIMDGYEATIRIRGLLGSDKLPIIAVTAHAMDEDRKRCKDVGMNGHISKPLDANVLINSIVSLLPPRKRLKSSSEEGLGSRIIPPEAWLAAGINREEVLARLLNKEELLKAILIEFLKEYDNFSVQLQKAVEGGQREVVQFAHTLKGTSGNIGASVVQERARALELAVTKEEPDLKDYINALQQAVDPVLDLVRRL